ncbi:hypothetical protein [Microlunatus speluncae]|uniref:hypothetical protein n=1 Tax=Microlunatus speluncae TaxID=2594267 RepID=UPI0012667C25|nr:hypothetical protein [Microlunatus speluncae]
MSRAARKDEAVQFRKKSLAVGIGLQITGWLLKRLGRLIWLLCSTPIFATPLLVFVGLVLVGHTWGATALVITGTLLITGTTAGMVVWQRRSPETFTRWVSGPARGQWRRLAVYRRWWPAAMAEAKLSRSSADRDVLARLGRVHSTRNTDRVRVKVLRGQKMSDWATEATRLAQAFDVEHVRIVTVWKRQPKRKREAGKLPDRERQLIDLIALRRDPLREGVASIDHPIEDQLDLADTVDLARLPIGWTEDHTLYRLPLLGNHTLNVGCTGAGKGSFIWNVGKALGPAVRSGRVRLLGIDPKLIELPFGEDMFHELITGDVVDETEEPDAAKANEAVLINFAEALERWARLMSDRLKQMKGKSRLHIPTPAEPLYVIFIDEMAALTCYITDRKIKDRIASVLARILTQGRAPGFIVIGCTQDPRKEAVPQRGLFTIRLGMRLNEAADTEMILGKDSIERGALCHEIDRNMPGTAYALVDGTPEAVRLRFPWISDDDIREMAQFYRPNPANPYLELAA